VKNWFQDLLSNFLLVPIYTSGANRNRLVAKAAAAAAAAAIKLPGTDRRGATPVGSIKCGVARAGSTWTPPRSTRQHSWIPSTRARAGATKTRKRKEKAGCFPATVRERLRRQKGREVLVALNLCNLRLHTEDSNTRRARYLHTSPKMNHCEWVFRIKKK
jgi:hypothetical protein